MGNFFKSRLGDLVEKNWLFMLQESTALEIVTLKSRQLLSRRLFAFEFCIETVGMIVQEKKLQANLVIAASCEAFLATIKQRNFQMTFQSPF